MKKFLTEAKPSRSHRWEQLADAFDQSVLRTPDGELLADDDAGARVDAMRKLINAAVTRRVTGEPSPPARRIAGQAAVGIKAIGAYIAGRRGPTAAPAFSDKDAKRNKSKVRNRKQQKNEPDDDL